MYAVALACALAVATVDKDVSAIEDVTLSELLGSDTTVSSAKTTRLRDAPGIVTVITRGDIDRIGARDVGEVLALVPGFDPHVDVFGLVGNTFRGLYASDGRTLILLDGVEMNDVAYGGAYTYARYPVDDVERIEILRGPGSARYGGYASLTVIQIITRSANVDGADVSFSYGQTALDSFGDNAGLTATARKHLDVAGGLDLAVSAHAGVRAQSRRDFADAAGNTRSLADASEARSLLLEATARLPQLVAHLVIDGYSQQNATVYGVAQDAPGRTLFPALYLDVRAPLVVSDGLTLTPHLFYTRQLPWRPEHADDFPDVGDFREVDDRLRLGATADWQALPQVAIAAGVEGTVDNAQFYAAPDDGDRDLDWVAADVGDNATRYGNIAVFADAGIDTEIFLLTMGARAELHSSYGSSFVPRVALTRVFDGAHVKLLVAGSFRAPGIDNIRFESDEIEPERARVLELEGGIALIDGAYLTVNAFDITINNPMIYFVADDPDAVVLDGYKNFTQTGSRGVEATLLATAKFGRLELNYSFATAAGKNEVPLYTVPGDDGRLLAAPPHKGVVVGSVFLATGVTATATAVARSERAAQLGYDADGAAVFGELPASVLVGGAVRLDDVIANGISLTLGVKNALGDDFRIAQPYASGHPPLPFEDREVYVRLVGAFD